MGVVHGCTGAGVAVGFRVGILMLILLLPDIRGKLNNGRLISGSVWLSINTLAGCGLAVITGSSGAAVGEADMLCDESCRRAGIKCAMARMANNINNIRISANLFILMATQPAIR